MCEHVVARSRSVTVRYDERGNELFVFSQSFSNPKVTFSIAHFLGALGPKLAASFFSWVVQFLRLDFRFVFGCFESVFVLSNELTAVSLVPCKTGCFVGVFFFASATDENRVQQVLFSFRFFFVLRDGCRGVHRVRSRRSTRGSKK